jgi:hypothetical protein
MTSCFMINSIIRKGFTMQDRQVTKDDFIDVMEMTEDLEDSIAYIFDENEASICMSALVNASINSMIDRCDTVDDFIFFKNCFIRMCDIAIRNDRIW